MNYLHYILLYQCIRTYTNIFTKQTAFRVIGGTQITTNVVFRISSH